MALVAQIVNVLQRRGGERAGACARVLAEAPLIVGEAAAEAVKALQEGPPPLTEQEAVDAYVDYLLGVSPRRVVYTTSASSS